MLASNQSFEIKNYEWLQPTKTYRHGLLFPSTIRALIVGPSNCGKTNIMLNLLENKNGLRFENVYVYSKSLNQPIYKYLEKMLSPITGIEYFKFKENDEIVKPALAKQNSIFIFDDVACTPQSVIRDYYCMGRHNLIDSFYLCQTYSHIPKHLIRDNANFLIIFKQDETNLKHIYNDHVNMDMKYNKFLDICYTCWREKFGFLTINKDAELNNGRYRDKLDKFIHIE